MLDEKPRRGRPKEAGDEELQRPTDDRVTRLTRELERCSDIDHATYLRCVKAMEIIWKVGRWLPYVCLELKKTLYI